jgi:hypothetical protein
MMMMMAKSFPPPAPKAKPASAPPPAAKARPPVESLHEGDFEVEFEELAHVQRPLPRPVIVAPVAAPVAAPAARPVAPVAAPITAPVAAPAARPVAFPVPVAVSAPPASQRTPPASQRTPPAELISTLFEHIGDLELLSDALEGAKYLLEVLATTMPSRAALVHLYDASRRCFVVVAASGEGKDSMVLARTEAKDPVLRTLMPANHPFALRGLRNVPLRGMARFTDLSHIDAVVAAPVSIGPRWMGVIELVDPVDGDGFGSAEENALAYVAERFAAFLSTRGVIVDVAAIAKFALTG